MSYFTYSFDELDAGGAPFATEDEAVDAAMFEAGGVLKRKPFYVFLCKEIRPSWSPKAEDIVDEIAESLSSAMGTGVVIDDIASDDEMKELDRDINRVVGEWIRKYNIGSDNYFISWTKRYIWDDESLSYVEDLDYA